MQLLEEPSPQSEPPFLDVQDFTSKLLEALEGHVPRGSTFTGIGATDAVQTVDRLRHDVFVVIDDSLSADVPVGDGQPTSGADAAAALVARALADIGFDLTSAPIDIEDVEEHRAPDAS